MMEVWIKRLAIIFVLYSAVMYFSKQYKVDKGSIFNNLQTFKEVVSAEPVSEEAEKKYIQEQLSEEEKAARKKTGQDPASAAEAKKEAEKQKIETQQKELDNMAGSYLERKIAGVLLALSSSPKGKTLLENLFTPVASSNGFVLLGKEMSNYIFSSQLVKEGKGKRAYCGSQVVIKLENGPKKQIRVGSKQVTRAIELAIIGMEEGEVKEIMTADGFKYQIHLVKIIDNSYNDMVNYFITGFGANEVALCGDTISFSYSLSNLDGTNPSEKKKIHKFSSANVAPLSFTSIVQGAALNNQIEVIIKKSSPSIYNKLIPEELLKQYPAEYNLLTINVDNIYK